MANSDRGVAVSSAAQLDDSLVGNRGDHTLTGQAQGEQPAVATVPPTAETSAAATMIPQIPPSPEAAPPQAAPAQAAVPPGASAPSDATQRPNNAAATVGGEVITVATPEAGEREVVLVQAGDTYVLPDGAFDPRTATYVPDGKDLVITLADGGMVVLVNFFQPPPEGLAAPGLSGSG